MKTLKMLLPITAVMILSLSCQKDNWYAAPPDAKGITNAPEVVTIPFKAEFDAKFLTVNHNPMTCCGTGTGTGTCFDDLKCNLTRCGNPATGECEFTKESYLYDANDHKIFFTASVRMVAAGPTDPAFYKEKWDTEYEITGGTGRFEGVSGYGKWHGYTTTAAGRENSAHSVLSGTLTIERSKLKE